MNKLTAAQRRFGMNMYVLSGKVDAIPDTEGRRMFVDSDSGECVGIPHMRIDIKSSHQQGQSTPGVRFPLLVGEIAHKESVIVELQRLLNEKDAEIYRLLKPTKWWRMLGWVIMAGTVLGVIAGVYEVIT